MLLTRQPKPMEKTVIRYHASEGAANIEAGQLYRSSGSLENPVMMMMHYPNLECWNNRFQL